MWLWHRSVQNRVSFLFIFSPSLSPAKCWLTPHSAALPALVHTASPPSVTVSLFICLTFDIRWDCFACLLGRLSSMSRTFLCEKNTTSFLCSNCVRNKIVRPWVECRISHSASLLWEGASLSGEKKQCQYLQHHVSAGAQPDQLSVILPSWKLWHFLSTVVLHCNLFCQAFSCRSVLHLSVIGCFLQCNDHCPNVFRCQ